MEKIKLAICMKDEEYKERFVKCVIKHYNEAFEVHVVNKLDEWERNLQEKYGAVIIEEYSQTEVNFSENLVFLVLQEEEEKRPEELKQNIYYAEKFQEVYKIIEELQKAISENIYVKNKKIEYGTTQRIGIFSLAKELLQIPFVALLADVLGEKNRVLIVDLQPFSGMSTEIETEEFLGMENLLSIASTENYTQNRLLASIGHEQKWEYIFPVENTSCLAEVGVDIYEKMLSILLKDKKYNYVIINFGTMFSGMIELMESCQELYILTEKQEIRNYRESMFLEEMNRRGKSSFLQRIMWTEIPIGFTRTYSWRQITKQWLWSSLGDLLREKYWVEYINGTNM